MSRQPGFYWVKENDEWNVMSWTGRSWVIPEGGVAVDFIEDHELHKPYEIDERQIVRTEPKISPECPDAHCQYTGECQASFVMREKCKMDPPSSDFIRKVDKLFGLL